MYFMQCREHCPDWSSSCQTAPVRLKLVRKASYLVQLPGADAGKPDVKGAAEKAVKKSPLGFMNIGELAFDLNLPGSNVKKTDLPNGPKPFDAGEVATPNLPSTDDLPSLPGNPTDQVTHSV